MGLNLIKSGFLTWKCFEKTLEDGVRNVLHAETDTLMKTRSRTHRVIKDVIKSI